MAAKLEDSNMANYGTDEHKQMRTDAAANEKAWHGVGQEPGILVWRIEKFEVVPWPKEQYGEFYDGDSYIVLHTYKEDDSDTLKHNVHFWLGANTTQDEAGSAAYKTVELDDFLGQLPVQYRQVQACESKEFLQLFPKITVLSGGVESGFNHVEPNQYEPRLLKVNGRFKKVQVYQVALDLNSMNSTDVFVLDGGLSLYQYNGDKCNVWEKRKGNEIVDGLQEDRSIDSKNTAIIEGFGDSGDSVDAFWEYFGGKPDSAPPDTAVNDQEQKESGNVTPTINKVTDDSGKVVISEVVRGQKQFKRSLLESDDCFIVDLGYSVYIWIGSGSSKAEKREAMKYAVEYCMASGRSISTPMVRVTEGNETEEFLSAFAQGVGGDDEKEAMDYAKENVKRHWQLGLSFEPKTNVIQLRVTDGVSKQQFGVDIGSDDVGGKDIRKVYKEEIYVLVQDGKVTYTMEENPPLIVGIGEYTFSCPQML